MISPSYLGTHSGFAFSSRSPPDTLNYLPTPGSLSAGKQVASYRNSPWLLSAVASPLHRPGLDAVLTELPSSRRGGLTGATAGSPALPAESATSSLWGALWGGGMLEAGASSSVPLDCPALGPAPLGAHFSWAIRAAH